MSKQMTVLPYSMVTPRSVYMDRRRFLATAIATSAASHPAAAAGLKFVKSPLSTSETQTPYQSITTYNNYYEFGTDKIRSREECARLCSTRPWTVQIEGEVEKPLKLWISIRYS